MQFQKVSSGLALGSLSPDSILPPQYDISVKSRVLSLVDRWLFLIARNCHHLENRADEGLVEQKWKLRVAEWKDFFFFLLSMCFPLEPCVKQAGRKTTSISLPKLIQNMYSSFFSVEEKYCRHWLRIITPYPLWMPIWIEGWDVARGRFTLDANAAGGFPCIVHSKAVETKFEFMVLYFFLKNYPCLQHLYNF